MREALNVIIGLCYIVFSMCAFGALSFNLTMYNAFKKVDDKKKSKIEKEAEDMLSVTVVVLTIAVGIFMVRGIKHLIGVA